MVRYSYPFTGLKRPLGVQEVDAAYVFFLVFSSLLTSPYETLIRNGRD
jgi:hypothetical protein